MNTTRELLRQHFLSTCPLEVDTIANAWICKVTEVDILVVSSNVSSTIASVRSSVLYSKSMANVVAVGGAWRGAGSMRVRDVCTRLRWLGLFEEASYVLANAYDEERKREVVVTFDAPEFLGKYYVLNNKGQGRV